MGYEETRRGYERLRGVTRGFTGGYDWAMKKLEGATRLERLRRVYGVGATRGYEETRRRYERLQGVYGGLRGAKRKLKGAYKRQRGVYEGLRVG